MCYDVVVVGAGPSGSMAAKYAAKNGARTLLIEEHGMIGSPVSCTGHISVKALNECELPEGNFINKRIRGAFVYAPNNHSIPIDGRRTMTYVVERKIFDRELAKAAASAGAEVLVDTAVRGVRKVPGGVVLDAVSEGKKTEIAAKVVIGADGVRSKVARSAGLGRIPHVCTGIQVEASYEPRDPEFVEVFLGHRYAPGYFAWSVPTTGGCCRIGLNADNDAHVYLERLLKEHEIVSKKARSAVDLIMGGIPVGTLKRTVSDGVLIVGDAAGQVKPISYGGIYTGAKCAKIAGEVAAKAALEGDVSAQRLMEYERRWRGEIGMELTFGLKARQIFGKMSDGDLNEAIAALDDPDILEMITKYGDIDHPSMLARQFLGLSMNKSAWRFIKLFARIII
ncbi:geranylgeranyl reductase family [Methanocella conradii HZ254]|uniref:Geranylgeranyl reductase family n=1 Tax=Methanocella conradii (strain DSM 24694 / JCM 17849 / CGMCC 1.5162 / HZ254) TaxID=1041930 RepID=H8I7Z2_METCZ|nr:NAD(P)/FAD-dependent oxidoreductase [Methanocella conradii]AFD00392.1 geranylgeranyl reductase family [Methanocella conradii HZ254]